MSQPPDPPPADIPVFQENYTSAAIDGARIGCFTASLLVSIDSRLEPVQQARILEALEQARAWLDDARELMPTAPPTSVHIVRPNEPHSGLILPGA